MQWSSSGVAHLSRYISKSSIPVLRAAMTISTMSSTPITLPKDLSKDQLLQFPAYKTWLTTLEKSLATQGQPSHPFHQDPYELLSINVQTCDHFGGGRLGFLKFKADVRNSQGESLPGAVFMRGGSVAMLIILQAKDTPNPEEHVLLTIQPRIAAGSLSFIELPAGMLDDSGTFTGAAAKEIKEETGLDIKEDELIDLTQLALQSRDTTVIETSDNDQNNNASDDVTEEPHLQPGIYPSPGACDEFIPILMARKHMTTAEIQSLKGKLTGLRDHGEKITLRICNLKDLWRVGARDGKTLAAFALYQGLKGEGRV